MALKIRRDDTVRIIAGKDQARTARAARRPARREDYVEGANIVKRRMRPRTLRDAQRAQELGSASSRRRARSTCPT